MSIRVKWRVGSVLYNPETDSVHSVITLLKIKGGGYVAALDNAETDNVNYFLVSVWPEGTDGVTVWTRLGEL